MTATNPTLLRTHGFVAVDQGPRLLVTGAVHGNETCGTQAIQEVIAQFDAGELRLRRGSVTFLPVANPLAFQLGQRMGERNLNRNLGIKAEPANFEDRVGNILCRLLAEHEVLLDLHSFTAPAAPFVMVGTMDPSSSEWRFARVLGPQRFVTGWMEVYEAGVARRRVSPNVVDDPGLLDASYGVGTTEYMRACGGYGVTLECGQHDDPAAVDVARSAILNALGHLGLIESLPSQVCDAPERLRLTEVIDREHTGDVFTAEWSSFSRVEQGDVVAVRSDGKKVIAPATGCIMFPSRYAKPGHEWFYFARCES